MPRRRGDSLVKSARDHIAGGEGYDAREILFKLMDKYPERVDREVVQLLSESLHFQCNSFSCNIIRNRIH
jgi:hypothetical protein